MFSSIVPTVSALLFYMFVEIIPSSASTLLFGQ